ncbi:hypothetical protein A11A3_09460 [Alcanivorax hongdengensis A-11-3]|uniref:Uncharacterized protein n=1 Tax=Alcanivorax hongdengensis A-11-3 TaxID=1177179 RepID=L0WB69_9GAMM|nr:hypothetical protein [Alcanivorax hongdengensis]EKF74216.1 hypothetical protein A11A3_09460 [Alcanivorax hongdengensis A-11-3]
MSAVIIGALIVIWLGLAMGAALLRWLGVQLHYPARLVAPLLLALVETVLFLLFVPQSELLPEGYRWPVAGVLVAMAWLVNGTVSALDWYRQHPPAEGPAPSDG